MTKIRHTAKIHFQRGTKSEKKLATGPKPTVSLGRVPRVARLLALAHRFQELVETGVANDYADLARLGHVTRARVTQIMNLLSLAPDLQEKILFWPSVTSGKDPISERGLRAVCAKLDWREQRALTNVHFNEVCLNPEDRYNSAEQLHHIEETTAYDFCDQHRSVRSLLPGMATP